MRTLLMMLVATAILSGCAQNVPSTAVRFVEVPSSKPYKFLKWSTQCPLPVNQGIRAHNRAHQAVINAEKKAKP